MSLLRHLVHLAICSYCIDMRHLVHLAICSYCIDTFCSIFLPCFLQIEMPEIYTAHFYGMQSHERGDNIAAETEEIELDVSQILK